MRYQLQLKPKCAVSIPKIERKGDMQTLKFERCDSDVMPGHLMCPGHWALMDRDTKHALLKRQREVGHKDRRADKQWVELAKESIESVTKKLSTEAMKAAA